jgi:hypothetical protein
MRFWLQIIINIVIVVVVAVSLVVVINRDCATSEELAAVEDKIDEIETKLDNYLPMMWDEIQKIEGKLDEIMPKIDEILEELAKPCCCEDKERQVKVKQIPVPWQFWRTIDGGVTDIIQLSDTYCQPVVVSREWAVLPVQIPLDNLTWVETEAMVMEYSMLGEKVWLGRDEEPVLLNPGDELTVDIDRVRLRCSLPGGGCCRCGSLYCSRG